MALAAAYSPPQPSLTSGAAYAGASSLWPTRRQCIGRRRPSAFVAPSSSAHDGHALQSGPNGIHASLQGAQYIGKTVESFKLADLYWLEACAMARCSQSEIHEHPDEQFSGLDAVDRLAFHRPTASYLLGYTRETHHSIEYPDKAVGEWYEVNDLDEDEGAKRSTQIRLPFRQSRLQYVARVVASGQSPEELLRAIRTISVSSQPWVLEYDTFEPLQSPQQQNKRVVATMLMCAVARLLPGEPLLTCTDLEKSKECAQYVMVETAQRLYLAQKVSPDTSHHPQRGFTDAIAKQFREAWSRRPFQYSGAINLDAALTIIDIMWEMLQRKSSSNNAIRILDPTCGSGTFLALALMAWGSSTRVEATGLDSNSKCAEGTVKNLKHLLSQSVGESSPEIDCNGHAWALAFDSNATIPHAATIYCEDSARLSTLISDKFDCAVANLPWNRNTFEYQGTNSGYTNSDIVKATATVLKPGSPVAVVSARDREIPIGEGNSDGGLQFNATKCLQQLGFRVLGEATIPPTGFELPLSGKKKMPPSSTKKRKSGSSSDCVITLAVSPE